MRTIIRTSARQVNEFDSVLSLNDLRVFCDSISQCKPTSLYNFQGLLREACSMLSKKPKSIQRKIALLDLDAFFAAAETLKNPALLQQPFAVGSTGERGVVATCNYLARSFGVRSAMPAKQAKQLCPQLIFVSPDFPFYKQLSKQVYALCQNYTDLIEPASIDEFYLDLSHSNQYQGSATLIMEALRGEIRALGITGSAGISNQKMVAKIASDDNKPDGQTVIAPHEVLNYLAHLPLNRIPGVGPKSYEKLTAAGLKIGHDIQQADIGLLQHLLGVKHGYSLYQRCRGIDNRPVVTSRVRKQVSVEDTLHKDLYAKEQACEFLQSTLLQALQKRLAEPELTKVRIRTQTVKLKFSDFKQTTVSRASERIDPGLFYQLLETAWQRRGNRGVRLIGIGVTLPLPHAQLQQEFSFDV